jgi:hypothetical protein
MQIGIVGAGTMGTALAGRLCAAGHHVVVGTRSPDKAWSLAGVARVSLEVALQFGDLSILALPWPAGLELIRNAVVPADRILLDVSNPETADGRGLGLGWSTSGAEELARAAPAARVIKGFSHFYAELLEQEVTFDGGTPSVLYCGDDADAKAVVRSLIASCGLDPVDAGALAAARYLEPLAMLTVGLVREQGWGPTGVAWRLMRRRD